MDFIGRIIKKILKVFFPKYYYSEKLQKFWFYLTLPSATKVIIFILLLIILSLIVGVCDSGDPVRNIYGVDKETIIENDKK